MQTFKLVLVAVVSSISTLALSGGCDVGRSISSTPVATVPPAGAQPPSVASAAAPETARAPVVQAPAAPVVQTQAPETSDTTVRVYRDVSPSVVTVVSSVVTAGFRSEPVPQGAGSGFMIDDSGNILTNNHVVQDADKLEVTLPDGTTIPAELVGRDTRFDLAIVRASIPREQVRAVKLGDSEQLQVGEPAIAIGNPYGLERTVTTGVVSGRRPAVTEPQGDGVLVNAIQTDAAINPGNSGGPLLNSRGEVIGVNTLGLQPSGAPAGLNFAIPVNTAKRALPDLIAGRAYAHPFVGIATAEITPSIAQTLGLPVRDGLLVQSVEPNSGAARAGVRGGSSTQGARSRQVAVGGDIIVAIDGQKVRRPEDFVAYLETSKRAGETVSLTIIREGQQRDVQVTLGERPRR